MLLRGFVTPSNRPAEEGAKTRNAAKAREKTSSLRIMNDFSRWETIK